MQRRVPFPLVYALLVGIAIGLAVARAQMRGSSGTCSNDDVCRSWYASPFCRVYRYAEAVKLLAWDERGFSQWLENVFQVPIMSGPTQMLTVVVVALWRPRAIAAPVQAWARRAVDDMQNQPAILHAREVMRDSPVRVRRLLGRDADTGSTVRRRLVFEGESWER
ncbi:unnamed protein product [Prorocentrum cordatum]|uniref:Uncharacterized protein n=1 Tax=Prorocentrum cordatum TaxID=2364126 RepID=A0ABN9T6I9_9DINO|nr:unnamed protein product [Polarella glacialis]